jgi:uroporphyrinogen decarboxylase
VTTKRDRLKATLSGEVADRPPFALWRHFPVDDQSPQALAEATVAFQREIDCDFIKVTPASSFCVRDWGVVDVWQGSTEGTRTYTARRVVHPSDWAALEPLDPRSGSLGEHLQCLEAVVQAEGEACPVLATVFSPLAQAKNLAGGDLLLEHLKREPASVLSGLREIARTTIRFVEAARAVGIDGIFYAVQHASVRLLDRESYARFGLPFDREILEAAGGLWLNILHLHGEDIDFELAASLSTAVVNWHDRETLPRLQDGRRESGKAVCGGLSRIETLVLGDPSRVRAEAAEAMRETGGGRGLVLGTGCVVPVHAPRANLLAARRAVEDLPPSEDIPASSRLAGS